MFFNVENASEFDPARLSPILSKYLEPEPDYEIFNNMKTPGGETYVLIVLSAKQQRPIMVVTEGSHSGKPYLRTGEIWIKRNTGLQMASKADLDLMYEVKIDQEAETRARRRFEHFREELGPALISQAVVTTPVPELLIGSRNRLARFIEAMISNDEPARFRMLLEMARGKLVEGWQAIQDDDWTLFKTIEERSESHSQFYEDEFVPALQSLVDIGLQVIKFDASPEWLELVVDLLVETFNMCAERAPQAGRGYDRSPGLPSMQAGFEVHLGARTLVTFALLRRRIKFCHRVLPKFVLRMAPSIHKRSFEPILFFPFSGDTGIPDMKEGRNEMYWNERIGATWGNFFLSKEKFLVAASELELILELNSYLMLNFNNPVLEKYRLESPEKRFAYSPDFWRNPINPALQVAEDIYDYLSTGSSSCHVLPSTLRENSSFHW